jgi:hypothetical protein
MRVNINIKVESDEDFINLDSVILYFISINNLHNINYDSLILEMIDKKLRINEAEY